FNNQGTFLPETANVNCNQFNNQGTFLPETANVNCNQFNNQGTFLPETANVNCNQFNNQGTFLPETANVNCNQFNNQGTFLPETANVNCNQLDNKGTLWATIMDVSDSINNENGQIKTENLQANLQKFDNSGGQLLVNGKTGTTSLNASEIINEKDGEIIVNTSEFNLQSSIIQNQSGKIQHTGQGLLNLSTQSLVNNDGQVKSNGHLIDYNKVLIHNGEDGIFTSHQMTLSGELHNDGGSVQAEKLNAALTGALHNDGGKISITGEQDNSSIEATEIHNSHGAAISSNCNLTLKTRQLNSDDTGKLTSGKNLTLFLEDSLDNQSIIVVKDKLACYLPGDLNNKGKLAGGQGVFIGKDEQRNKCNSLNNSSGSIISGDGSDMEINAQSVINRKEIFKSVQRKSADPVTFQKEYRKKNKLYTQPVCTDYTTDCIEQDSQPGLMVAGRDLSINSNYVHNQFSHILSYGNININSNRLHNQGFIPKETKHTFIKEQRGYTDKGDECHPARIKEKFNKKACKLDWLPGSVKNSKRIADQSAVDLMPRFHCPKKKNYLVCDKTETYNVGDCEGSIKACGTTKITCKN
ncbi:MAG: hypothetical protein OXC48_05960, partial [Endozoicomonadaceae bacterium]|nr:hypothetical protein [Endozoicomonadaceae bacterium]